MLFAIKRYKSLEQPFFHHDPVVQHKARRSSESTSTIINPSTSTQLGKYWLENRNSKTIQLQLAEFTKQISEHLLHLDSLVLFWSWLAEKGNYRVSRTDEDSGSHWLAKLVINTILGNNKNKHLLIQKPYWEAPWWDIIKC